MTSSPQQCRYALWHHPSQEMNDPIVWRQTPRSKSYVGIVAPVVVPGQLRVVDAGPEHIELQLEGPQMEAISHWACGSLPGDVLPPTSCETGILKHCGRYTTVEPRMAATDSYPRTGERVRVRLVAGVHRIGPVYKSVLTITDVLRCDVT